MASNYLREILFEEEDFRHFRTNTFFSGWEKHNMLKHVKYLPAGRLQFTNKRKSYNYTYSEESANMSILTLNFTLYTLGGMWRPIEWSSNCARLLYGAYSVFVLYLMIFMMVTQFLDIVFVIDNVEDFTTNSMLCLSVVSAICKAITGVTSRDRIIDMITLLQEEPCKPCTKDEIVVQMKFDDEIRSYSITYLLLATSSATGAFAGAVFAILQGELPMRVWVPYDYTSPPLFWFTSVQLLLALIIGTIINVSTETLVLGLCLQTCAQFELLTHRLQKKIILADDAEARIDLSNETLNKRSRLSGSVFHHVRIIRYAEMLNETYSQVFFVQFFASILVLCSGLYYLSSHITVEDIMTMAVYVCCMFAQIYVYCWAGNEVMLKSMGLSDALYQVDWLLMTIRERKDLLMIMKRSTRPIKFTSNFLVTLSLNSYGKLLKASYSAFNVLQQS